MNFKFEKKLWRLGFDRNWKTIIHGRWQKRLKIVYLFNQIYTNNMTLLLKVLCLIRLRFMLINASFVGEKLKNRTGVDVYYVIMYKNTSQSSYIYTGIQHLLFA